MYQPRHRRNVRWRAWLAALAVAVAVTASLGACDRTAPEPTYPPGPRTETPVPTNPPTGTPKPTTPTTPPGVGAAWTWLAPPADGCAIPTGVAHRGGTDRYTENTLLAYTHVWAWGVNDWETDIRFDATGIPVLMHDATIDRTTTGSGNVSSLTWSSSTVTMNDGQLLRNQTLGGLLALASAKGATVAIEPKVVPNSNQVSRVLDLLDQYGMRDRVLLDSFEEANLAPFKAAAPDLTYSLVTSTAVTPSHAADVGPVLNIAASALTEQLVDDYHAAGVSVSAWTLDTPAEWAPRRNWGIDRYVTNQAKDYRAWRDWVCRSDAWEGEY